MEIKRQKPVVEAYHFDMRTPEDNVEPKLNVGFAPLKAPDENYPKENSILGARLQFQVVLAEFIIRGTIGQINHIIGRQISKSDDLSREEANELVEPLFDMLQRLTYEVTEIATDKPGIKLNFNQEEE
ncbi:DUF1149 family protein [Candidatus Enterococcus willemsii]|uniref:Transposase n=1 Tax=Candidatus Enterococcus willemsii TaxID=1857215 RepID=A0ABQ6YXP4_9ENTE|nr:DUF1149 family protein [Enterococcus sp. CU12B]KAF1302752.1 hypothetical protein BAU17_05560 [Enterococcus sp. CU12B]